MEKSELLIWEIYQEILNILEVDFGYKKESFKKVLHQ